MHLTDLAKSTCLQQEELSLKVMKTLLVIFCDTFPLPYSAKGRKWQCTF